MLTALRARFDAAIWDTDLQQYPRLTRWGVVVVRLLQTLARDIQTGEINMRAMGLVYTTLLSLVPLLALAFSMLKAFGVNGALRPVLYRFFAPLGAQSDELVDRVVDFVENVQVGVLGAVGVALLLYSVISLIQKVEAGCNYIWQVRRPRSMGRRFTEYLSVLIFGPIVVLAASSVTASLTSNAVVDYLGTMEPFGATLFLIGKLVPYVLYTLAFTFLFAFMPNTKVRLLPAFGGGLFAGVLWQSVSLGFAVFARNASNYNAIYSSFAILLLLLIWMYVSWLILLVGCRVAFLLQYNNQLSRKAYPPTLSAYHREELALIIMNLIGAYFMQGREPWQVSELARRVGAAPSQVDDVVDQLVAAGVLVESGDTVVTLLPRQDIECLQVNAILDAVREPSQDANWRGDIAHGMAARWLAASEQARREALDGLSLRALVSESLGYEDKKAARG